MQDSFVVEEGVMTTLDICLRKREASILQEVQFDVSYLMSKVRAFAHLTCNGHTHLEAWLFAHLVSNAMCSCVHARVCVCMLMFSCSLRLAH